MKTSTDSFGFTTALIMGAARLYYGTVITLKGISTAEKITALKQFKKTAGETINVMVDEYIGELRFEDSGDEGGQNVSM